MKHFLVLPLLLLLMALSMASQGQTVTLDQADMDYAPGETVFITGTDFLPGESVTMTISHIEPGLPLIYHEHALIYAIADSTGTFNASWYVEDVELNTTLSLLAEGDQGSVTSVVFTDAVQSLWRIDAEAQSGVLTYGTPYSATFAMAGQLSGQGGKPTVRYRVRSGLPIGANAPEVRGSGGNPQNATLTVNTSETTPAGSFTLTIEGYDGVYMVTTTATLTINKRSLNFTSTKVYDASTTFTADQLNVGNVVNADVIGLAGNATVSSKNVGGYSNFVSNNITTTNANYQVTAGAINVSITPKALTVSDAVANSKVYDRTNTTSITGTLNGIISSDVVSLNGTGIFTSLNVANDISVISTSTLGGAQAGNYSLTQPTGLKANIIAKTVSVSGANASNKVYDGTNIATISGGSLDGVILPDVVTLIPSGIYASVNVANGISVTSTSTLGGGQAGNYILTQPTGLTANITPKTLTITGVTTENKVYDATINAKINTNTAVLSGLISGDDVSLGTESASGTFASKSVGTSKAVAFTGFSITGADAGNYTLTQPSATANITAKAITGSVSVNNKVYDGNVSTTIVTRSLSGVIALDVVTYTGGNANFSDKNVGAGKTVTVTGLSLTGSDAGNYTVNTTSTTSANITAKPLSITNITAKDKVYDGTISVTLNTGSAVLSGMVSGDVVNLNKASATGAFADKNVGNGKAVTTTGFTITGIDAGNYLLAQFVTTANITAKFLTAEGITGNNKVYDGTTSATLNTEIAILSGVVLDDDVLLNSVNGTGTFASAEVGVNKTITASGFAISGSDAGNYSLIQPTGLTANITQKPLIISGVIVNNKIYDGNTAAILNTTAATLVGAISGDNVNLNSTGATALFADKNVGNGKVVTATGFILGGNEKTNYTLSQPSGLIGNITVRLIIITADTQSKIYGDPDLKLTAKATNVVNGDKPTGALSRAAGENVGSYLISKDSYTYGSNYAETFVEGINLIIGQRPITIKADAQSKTYGEVDPTLTAQATNVVKGDNPTGALSRAAGENVGSYLISKDSYTYGSNYAETFEGANLVISQRPITITADAKSKTYGNPDPVLTAQASNVVKGDNPTGALSRAAGENVGSYAISKSTYTYGSNYAESFVEGINLVIGQRPITITADKQSKTYGDPDPALTAQASDVVNGDKPTGALSRAAGENVGSYAISKSTYTYGSNYAESFVEGINLIIGQRPITIKADPQSKTYGEADPTLTAQATNVVKGDNPTGALSRATGENVGSYLISKDSYTYGSNYAETFEEANLVIGQRPITIKADTKTKIYGDGDPTFTAQATNVVEGDKPTGALSREVGENVGSYAISKSTYTYGSNYAESFEGANLVIGQRLITITADAKSKIYGNPDPTLTAQASNVVKGDNPTGALSRAAGENVGSYAISKSTYTYGSNYAESFVEGINLVIGQRPITITADKQSKTYGDADPALTAQASDVVNGDKPTGALSRAAGENVGSYAISKSTYTYGPNYAESFVEGINLVIGQRPITIKADAKTKIYGDSDPILTAQATNVVNDDKPSGNLSRVAGENVGSYLISKDSYTYGSNYAETFEGANLVIGQRSITIKADAKGKIYGNADPELTAQASNVVKDDKPSGNLSRVAGENVGSYLISKDSYTYGSNYAETFEGANLVIGQRPITITADKQSKTYGDPDPALTAQASNVVKGDNPTGALSRAAGENVGSYAISKSTYTYGGNYAETFVEGINLVIGQRPITIKADAKTKIYGDADPTLTAQATNVVNDDKPSGNLSRVAGENVGSYLISKDSYTYGSNYAETFEGANLVIGQRPITITADAKSKIYGNADPELTAQATNVVKGDNPTGALSRAAGENVGSYAISKSTYTYGGNYAETFVEGINLVIGQRPITIKADAQSKTYGEVDPTLTAQATNVVKGDNPTGALSRAAGENVGSYLISKDSYTYGSNYAETFEGANLVISQRPITITADAKSKTYGNPDPVLTAQASNVVKGDNPTGALSRAAGENVGSYAISKSTYTYGSNYAESFVEGINLIIGQRPITIKADPQSKTYGEADPTLTAQATNVVKGDNPTGALSRATGENVGSYLISKDSYTYGSNYAETFEEANLVIGQRPITIKADTKTKIYGDGDPTFTAQATNVVEGDKPTGALSREVGENVGSYAISKSTYTYGSNYAESFVGANLVINQLPVTVTAQAKSKIYGDADPVLTFVADPAVGSELANGLKISFTGSLVRSSGENVGDYSISIGSVANTNYSISHTDAKLTITQRPVAITAVAKTKYIGQVDPALTYEITNGSLAFNDAFSGSLLRVAGECTGTYLINQGNVALSTNYALSYKGANFTINGLTIDASQSSCPVPTGTAGTLIAKVTPAVAGVKVYFTLDNGTTAIFPCYDGVTGTDGIAKCTLPVMPVEVYKITANVGMTNSSSYCTSSTAAYLAVYDPNGGFVTGGGWINSPAGSYSANASLTGKANFGFNSKYEKGKTTPTGNTEFQFQAGNLNFSSSTYGLGSLVISGAKATYKGVGTINGSGSYAFMVSAIDGDVTGGNGIDRFRIKIWDGNNVIYDNNMSKDENDAPTTCLGGGSIVIHSNENKPKVAQILPDVTASVSEPTLKVYPNPFAEKLNIEFSYGTDTRGKLEIYSITGAKLQTLYDGPVTGGQLYNFEYLPRLVSSQVVFYHLTLDGKTQVGKVLFNERR